MRNLIKKTSLTIAACLIVSVLFAQKQKVASNPVNDKNGIAKTELMEKKAHEKAQLLKYQLNLSDEQEKSVTDLNMIIAAKTDEGKQTAEELDAVYMSRMAEILQPDQLVRYQQQINDEKERQASYKKLEDAVKKE